MPTKSKKNQKEPTFPENQVMMMLENMNDGIKILAEGQQGLSENLNEFKVETRNNFKKVDDKLESFKKETRDNFKKVDKKFTKVFNSFDEIKQEVKDIKRELSRMKKQPVIKREEFEILVKRVEVVEMSIER